ncbi:hypothetical protein CN169_33305 [Sinorhizobium meliloti]|nr:hypothetical protein CN169_33305 [Sinorhizobium meliloti]
MSDLPWRSRVMSRGLSIFGLSGAQKKELVQAIADDGALERDAFRRNRKGDSFFCANQIHHSGR